MFGVMFGDDKVLTFGEFATIDKAKWYAEAECAGEKWRVVCL